MGNYVVRRILQGILILFIISAVCFALVRASADPMSQYATNARMSAADRERLRASLGLDQPLPVQYLYWLGNTLTGNLGYSSKSHQAVLDLIMQRLPNTLILMLSAEVVIVIFSLFLGVYSAIRQYSLFDNIVTAFSFIGYSMPVFFIGLMLIFIFAVGFKNMGWPYLPFGADVWDHSNPISWLRQLVLPVVTLAAISTAGYTRYLRSSMLETMNQDYIRTARAKGLKEETILMRHALKNAALPFVTVVGLDLPFLLGGALVTEQLFSFPGMGRLFWDSANFGDYPVVMAILLLVAMAVVTFQIMTDVVYTFLDPRIKLS
ncbi:MAG: ABC transporter permease [Anaerolineae bacterium]